MRCSDFQLQRSHTFPVVSNAAAHLTESLEIASSSFFKLQGIIIRCFGFVTNAKKPTTKSKRPLTSSELSEAFSAVVKRFKEPTLML